MSNGLINRQYVGARYVPKIMGEWNKALQYEALSVVTYMGNSFTSRVPVPANKIDINNEEYWINTGNYNAQVENYRLEVEQTKKELEEDMSKLPKKINNMSDRFFIFNGDSYGAPSYVNNWVQYCTKMLRIKNSQYINCCIGGSGFDTRFTDTFYSNIKNIESQITDKTNVTDIVCCGGFNDANQYVNNDNINNGIYNFIKYCKDTYPNARIYIGFIGWFGAGFPNLTNDKFNHSTTVLNLYKNAIDTGAVYLNGVENIMHNYKLFRTEDFIHPNSTGAKFLGRGIFNAIITGNCETVGEITSIPCTSNSGISPNSFQLWQTLKNDVITTSILSSIKFTGDNLGTLTQNSQTVKIELGSINIPDDNLYSIGDPFAWYTGYAVVKAGGVYTSCLMNLNINLRKINVKLINFNTTQEGGTITEISLYPISFTSNTIRP